MSKILLIEDDIFLGDVLMEKLKAAGYEARLSRDGVSGLRALREWKPDLLLLDIILPNKNGYEVLEEKLRDKMIAKIPVIVISNSGQPVEINRALALGVKDYLVKAQFDPEEVLIKVRLQLSGGETAPRSSLPAAQAQKGGEKNSGAAALQGRKIMWVEDDKFLSDIIARKLSAQGSVLIHASDGGTALKILENESPDIVLLDILLSGIDGYEILKRMKSAEKTKHIPVILLSNLGQKSDVEKGKALGAARFLIKATVTLDEIVEEIKAVLKEVSSK